jgi:glycosyltransferase involved in cell wall biosynthesis
MTTKIDAYSHWPAYEKALVATGKPWIIYTGWFQGPGSGAPAENAFAYGHTLAAAGYSPLVLPFSDEGRPQDLGGDGRWIYEDIPYLPVGKNCSDGSSVFQACKSLAGFIYPLLDFLKKLAAARRPLPSAIILMEAGVVGSHLRLRGFCKKHGISLVPVELEWHHLWEPTNRKRWFDLIDEDIRKRFINPTLGHVIVNNTYLLNYYQGRGCQTVLLPPVLDTRGPRWSLPPAPPVPTTGKLRLVFSGTPLRERHDLILEAIAKAVGEGVDIEMNYIGFTKEYFLRLPGAHAGWLSALGDRVRFHGWLSGQELKETASAADFLVIFRNDALWSKACFPTKVPEFLALGVPVICNLTSDLAMYLSEGREALIVPELSAEALARRLKDAAALKGTERAALRMRARQRAEESFDWRRYADGLGRFMEAAIKSVKAR